jgi:hypothetical protein
MQSPGKVGQVSDESVRTGAASFAEDDIDGEIEVPARNRGANLLFLFLEPGFVAAWSRVEAALGRVPVLKDFFLIIRPTSTWNSLVLRPRNPGFDFLVYLLPLILLVALAEGYGLVLLGRQQMAEGMNNRFVLANVVVYEIASWLLLLFLGYLAAALIKSLANATYQRNTLKESLALMVHSLGPMFLVQSFNGFPNMYRWLTWIVGITLTMGALYQGLPRILRPDPSSAMGLFISSAIVVFLLFFAGCLLTSFYLAGEFKSLEASLNGVAASLSCR